MSFSSLLSRYLLGTAIIVALGCEQASTLEQIQTRGVLNVATRNGPVTYFPALIGHDGFEFRLAGEFADYLGVELNMVSVFGRDDVFRRLKYGKADLASAGLIITPTKLDTVRYSAAYYETQPRVIYKLGTRKPRKMEDLYNKRIAVGADSYFEAFLEQLQIEHPDIKWKAVFDLEAIDLMEQLNKDELDFAIMGEHEFVAHRGIYPRLSLGMRLGSTQRIAWAMQRSNGRAASLYTELDRFLMEMHNSGRLKQLQERYFSHFEDINQADALEFAGNIQRRLPLYEKLIRSVATEFNMPWELLAAISYQESHWNPNAVSPTGVVGMMMLTQATAEQVNIEDRANLEQSLRGGAGYFKDMLAKIPEDVSEPDRTWFALAAYNVGYGHLEDARKLTESQGFDPHIWLDLKEHLPLLRQRKWYSRTRYGYARGNEPVTYVHNIRHYYQVLRLHEIARERVRPPVEMSHRAPEVLSRTIPAI
ncbi:MAG: membrane-bound lytic murein transglycosylase MltF [Pseudomonadales bacterium]